MLRIIRLQPHHLFLVENRTYKANSTINVEHILS